MWNTEFKPQPSLPPPLKRSGPPGARSPFPERESGSHRLDSGRRASCAGEPAMAPPRAMSGERRRISKYEREKDLLSSATRAFMSNKRVQQGNEGVTRE